MNHTFRVSRQRLTREPRHLPFVKLKKPIVFAHGSADPILNWRELYSTYETLLEWDQDYPVRYYLYNGGIHGTPIRMIDWREALNWIFKASS